MTPDLSTFGKALANGFPIAALAGKQAYLDLAISPDPAKRVLVAGTYNCHPVPVAAAMATLKKLSDPQIDVYGRLEQCAATAGGRPAQVVPRPRNHSDDQPRRQRALRLLSWTVRRRTGGSS